MSNTISEVFKSFSLILRIVGTQEKCTLSAKKEGKSNMPIISVFISCTLNQVFQQLSIVFQSYTYFQIVIFI